MKYNIFDVIELNDGRKATILGCADSIYKVEAISEDGAKQDIQEIKEMDIKNIIVAKKG